MAQNHNLIRFVQLGFVALALVLNGCGDDSSSKSADASVDGSTQDGGTIIDLPDGGGQCQCNPNGGSGVQFGANAIPICPSGSPCPVF